MSRILVVDDEASIRTLLRRILERGGFEVIEAPSPIEALPLAAGPDGPDAVVSDIQMPEMNGLEFYQRLTAEVPRLRNRVIFLTGMSGEPIVHQRIEDLGAPLFGKPSDLHLVADALRLMLLRPPQS